VNPNPDESFLGVLTDDVLGDGTPVVIDPTSCVNGIYNAGDGLILVDAGKTMTCSYSADRGNKLEPTSNTARIDWNYGTALYDESSITLTPELDEETDKCIDLSDSIYGDLGWACAPGATVFEYSVTVGAGVPAENVDFLVECGFTQVENIADFSSQTTPHDEDDDTGSDNWLVDVNVACATTQLAPTQVDCTEFRSGTAPDLYLEVNKAGQVSPGRFFYYYDLPAIAWPGTVIVTQTVEPYDQPLHTVAGVKVFADDCSNIVKSDGVSWVDNGNGIVTITVGSPALDGLSNVAFRIEYSTADDVPAGTVYTWSAWGAEDEMSEVFQK
jgi:hypothetical protein